MSLSTYYLEDGRHLARLHRRRSRRAFAPTSNTASHDNHEKINSWVSFSFLYGYGAPLGGPSGCRSFHIMCIYKAKSIPTLPSVKTLPYLPYAPVIVLVTSRFRKFRRSALLDTNFTRYHGGCYENKFWSLGSWTIVSIVYKDAKNKQNKRQTGFRCNLSPLLSVCYLLFFCFTGLREWSFESNVMSVIKVYKSGQFVSTE